METSTPINSPMRKKHSLVQKFIPVEETLGDIESEIQTRRQEAINKSTEVRKRLSAAPLLAGFTATQLAQHCKDVIKLSTENKINCKNAFNFWLIDVMAAMAKKTDSEINKNFQVASCTLDASVKIYGYRVDAIHTDAVKIAGRFFSKEVLEENEKEDDNEGGEEENPTKPKLKKKKKKSTVVSSESLNAKSEAEVLMDVIPRQNFLSRKTNGNDLLVKIPKYNDGGLLLLDSDYPCWPYDDNSDLVPKFENKEIFDHVELISILNEIKISKDDEMCSAYSNFVFGKGCEDNSDSEEELHTSQNSCRFDFDLNASVHDVSMSGEEDCEPENQRNRINIPVGGFDSDEEIVIQPEKPQKTQSLAISDMKTRISVNPLEYSMFDEKMFRAWAGPAHWKVRPMRKPLEENQNNDVSKPVASKRTRKGKIKVPVGLFDTFEDVLVKSLAECEKTTLFKSTMLNWNPANTTMPEDKKCKAKNLFSLYHIPSFAISPKPNDKTEIQAELSDHHEEENDGDEHEDEEEDELEYCSTSVVQHDPILADEEQNFQDREEAWVSANMVEAPNKVKKIPVSSFKRRKHVDIKHLKRGLWNILTKSETNEEKEIAVTEAVEFSELIKIYPSKVPKNFSSLLSAPLIFNALLHLTNEKSLVLTQDKNNKMNFVISQ